MAIASAQYTITDLNDPYQQGTEPDYPQDGMLWVDTSGTAPVLKRYSYDTTTSTGSWEVLADADDHGTLSAVFEKVSSLTIDDVNGLRGAITTVSLDTAAVDGKLSTYQNKVESYIQFNESGLELGKSDSEFKTVITNTEMDFKQGSEKVAYISNSDMYISKARVTNTLSVGSIGSSSSQWFDFLMTDAGMGIKRRVGSSS